MTSIQHPTSNIYDLTFDARGVQLPVDVRTNINGQKRCATRLSSPLHVYTVCGLSFSHVFSFYVLLSPLSGVQVVAAVVSVSDIPGWPWAAGRLRGRETRLQARGARCHGQALDRLRTGYMDERRCLDYIHIGMWLG